MATIALCAFIGLGFVATGVAYKVNEESKQMERAKEDARDRELANRIDAVCIPETERLLARVYNSRILDRHPGNGMFGDAVSVTTTGWMRRISATVAGQKNRFYATCHVDKSFRLLDLQHSWQ